MRKWLGLTLVFGLVVLFEGMALGSDTTTVTVSATVVGSCKFLTGGTVAFGNLDPSVGTDKNATVTQPTFWCTKNASYSITDDHGLNYSGGKYNVRGATHSELIPYTFTYTSSGTGSGPASSITMNIAGTILGADYVSKPADTYSDTVTLTITP